MGLVRGAMLGKGVSCRGSRVVGRGEELCGWKGLAADGGVGGAISGRVRFHEHVRGGTIATVVGGPEAGSLGMGAEEEI